MKPPTAAEVSSAFRHLIDPSARISQVQLLSGGCISHAMQIALASDRLGNCTLFAKSNTTSFADNFECERDGLEALAAAQAIAVPQPIAVGTAAERSWLVTEWVQAEPPVQKSFSDFGRQLAELHRATAGNRIGWPRASFLGSAIQPNTAARSWSEFVAQNRIGYQLRWAVDQRLADAKLRRQAEEIIAALSQLLAGRADETSLLHGDLWSGNYLFGYLFSAKRRHREAVPVIIDPAVYYGCREAEFGMLKLFGSCPAEFYAAYQTTWPLAAGWERRINIYVLYHLLNHLNMFGSGYLSQCHRIASEILHSK